MRLKVIVVALFSPNKTLFYWRALPRRCFSAAKEKQRKRKREREERVGNERGFLRFLSLSVFSAFSLHIFSYPLKRTLLFTFSHSPTPFSPLSLSASSRCRPLRPSRCFVFVVGWLFGSPLPVLSPPGGLSLTAWITCRKASPQVGGKSRSCKGDKSLDG